MCFKQSLETLIYINFEIRHFVREPYTNLNFLRSSGHMNDMESKTLPPDSGILLIRDIESRFSISITGRWIVRSQPSHEAVILGTFHYGTKIIYRSLRTVDRSDTGQYRCYSHIASQQFRLSPLRATLRTDTCPFHRILLDLNVFRRASCMRVKQISCQHGRSGIDKSRISQVLSLAQVTFRSF